MPITQESKDDLEKSKILDGDGTAPKAVPEDTSAIGEDGTPLSPKEHAGVQFISPSRGSGNGDAKVELGGIGATPQFVGLGKEELMRYANDPFWVRLRWFLFILFWLIWLGMLAAAIAIIVMAPKCTSTASVAKSFVNNGPFYQIDLKALSGPDKFAALKDRVDYISALGMKTVIISQFQSASDLTKVDEAIFGSTESLEALLLALDEKKIRVLFQLSANHVSKDYQWQEGEDKSKYFVLKDAAETNKSTWKSVYNESAWSPYGDGSNNYLHQFLESQADINYENEDVVKKMNGILQHWFKFNNGTGILGFLLSDVSYLVEDLNHLDKQESTINQDGNKAVLQKLLDGSKWNLGLRTVPVALLDVNGLDGKQSLEKYTGETMMPVVSDLAPYSKITFNAEDLKNHALSVQPNYVIRRLSGSRLGRVNERFSRDQADILATVAYLLRGDIIVYYGDEIGLTNPGVNTDTKVAPMNFSPDSAASKTSNFYKCLAEVHHSINQTNVADDTGTTYDVHNETFIFKRNDKYVVVANLNKETVELDLSGKLSVPSNGTLRCATPNTVIEFGTEVNGKSFLAASGAAYVIDFGAKNK